MRAQRPRIELLTRLAKLVRRLIRLVVHDALRPRISQCVVHVRIDELRVAKAKALPRAERKVRRVRHRFHAARQDNGGLIEPNQVIRQRNRAHAGGADLIDGLGATLDRNADTRRHLTRHRVHLPGLDDRTDEGVVDVGTSQPRPLDRCSSRNHTQIDSRGARQIATEATKRGTSGANEDGASHGDRPPKQCSRRMRQRAEATTRAVDRCPVTCHPAPMQGIRNEAWWWLMSGRDPVR